MPNIVCGCKTTGGNDVYCSTGSGYGTPNFSWHPVLSSECCAGGSVGGGMHPMCNGNSCSYFMSTTCLGSVVPTTNAAGEQEALWGYNVPNLTVDSSGNASYGAFISGNVSFGDGISTQAYDAIVQPQSKLLTPCSDFITSMSPSEDGTWGSSGDIDCCQMHIGNFIGPYGANTPPIMMQTHCDQEWININGTSVQPNGWTGCCMGGRPGPVAPVLEPQDGFTYKTPRGTIWPGLTHNMEDGQVMSGDKHDINGSGSKGRSEILTRIHIVYLTPSGKQWCGDKHKSMLGTLMSGQERDVFGSGPDGKSELLSKLVTTHNLHENVYQKCKTDEPKPSWNCTSIGCMFIPSWWTPGQFTGPNAYADCMTDCTSWECASYTLFPPFNFELCLCFPVKGTGATQTYPTEALCQVAANSDPCCTDDENTYNCTLNGCEVHTGPGVGTYNQVPYALYECQQDCVSWGCHDVAATSAQTTTGYSFTPTATTATTIGTAESDLCIMVFYDITSMGPAIRAAASTAINQWVINESVGGGVLSAWTGTFIDESNVLNQPGWHIGGERWLRWPGYAMDEAQLQYGAMPCPGYGAGACDCRNILAILLIDEANTAYYAPTIASPQMPRGQIIGPVQLDLQMFHSSYDSWTGNGGTFQTLIYPARGDTFMPHQYTNLLQQVLCVTQGDRLDPALQILATTYNPTWGNIETINGNPIYGNPGQANLPFGQIANFGPWIESPWITSTNPFPGVPAGGGSTIPPPAPVNGANQYSASPWWNCAPLEESNVYGIYDRRGPGSFNVTALGNDLTNFITTFPTTSTTVTNWSVTAITSNTVTINYTLYNQCLSAETIPYPDYPFDSRGDCQNPENNCTYIGWNCGINGCYAQPGGTWFHELDCLEYCQSWSCVTRNDGIIHEWNVQGFYEYGHHCHEVFPATAGNTNITLYMGVTGSTYDFVSHCFNEFLPNVTYPPTPYWGYSFSNTFATGIMLGGLWHNTGATLTPGYTSTTIVNGLVVHDGPGGNCETWHTGPPIVKSLVTSITQFKLIDMTGNVIFNLGFTGNVGSMNEFRRPALVIIRQLANGQGGGWATNGVATGYSPDWPNGMDPNYVAQGKTLDNLILYGQINPERQFTVEVWVYGCPCKHSCWCKKIPGIGLPDTWDHNDPNSYTDCTTPCCERITTYTCPKTPYLRDLLCNNCPNGGGCYDPTDGSGIHYTEQDCEDNCEVSWDCHADDPVSTLWNWNTQSTCPDINYYLPLNLPTSYFQNQDPGWEWGNSGFTYGSTNGSGVSNPFEAFIYIFDKQNGLYNKPFKNIGFWPGSTYESTGIWCEYPGTGDKTLGMIGGFKQGEFSQMYCIDHQIRVNKRPWLTTKDPMINGIPHPFADFDGYVVGASTTCGRRPEGGMFMYGGAIDKEHIETHKTWDWDVGLPTGSWNSYVQYTNPYNPIFKSVKELTDKIEWVYSQPAFVETYGWDQHHMTTTWATPVSKNKVHIGVGCCNKFGRALAPLFNPGPNQIKCHNLTPPQCNNCNVPDPSNGLRPDLKLRDFHDIGMFYNIHHHLGNSYVPWTPYGPKYAQPPNGYNPFKKAKVVGTNFSTLSKTNPQLAPAVNYNSIAILQARKKEPSGPWYGNSSPVATNMSGVFECQCSLPCHCEPINGLLGDHLLEIQCLGNCCPDQYSEICCQPNNGPPTSFPLIVGCLSTSSCYCPSGYHQVACPW